jgi:hypothetical protein
VEGARLLQEQQDRREQQAQSAEEAHCPAESEPPGAKNQQPKLKEQKIKKPYML